MNTGKEKFFSALAAIGIVASGIVSLVKFGTESLDSYGAAVFLAAPAFCGAICSLLYNRRGNKRLGESLSVALLAGGLSLLGFLLTGTEGLICIGMALPIILPLFALGGLAGYWISTKIRKPALRDSVSLLLFVCVPLWMGFESASTTPPESRSVTTVVVITGSIEKVWTEVVAFAPIPEPEEFLFRLGIAYPTRAEIRGHGIGAVRYCHFSTGAFVEPITAWEENRLLAFDVAEQPEPMTEISPYLNIHPPHLDWAIRSQKGAFNLTQLDGGKVELSGTTWYANHIEPTIYWGWLSDEIIHAIHYRVLNHIKSRVEGESLSDS